jgi:O-antigen chain-terminating methyltransferase
MTLTTTDGLGSTSRKRIEALEEQLRDLVRELTAANQHAESLERQLVELRQKVEGSGPRFAALYAEFADQFRGTAEQITAKLEGYLPDVRKLVAHSPDDSVRVLDIGCGRGEWLTLLQRIGVRAAGVDSHSAFVEAGRAQGLDMAEGDGIDHLRRRNANSLDLVTAFHLIEHLDIESVLTLIAAAHDALRPGGCLLLETPNPTNLQMAACDFYNDPTHRAPLPPALTAFLVSASGFADVEVRHLHPAESPLAPPARHRALVEEVVERALYGPQDYAVLGFKGVPAGTV